MRTQQALRYLLLRHLAQFEGEVEHSRFLEVTSSLRVEAEPGEYVVTWKAGDELRRQSFATDAFAFYRRGDTRPETRSVGDELANRNDAEARVFAEQVFGIEAPRPGAAIAEPLESHPRWALAEAAALPLGLAVFGGLPPLTALALLALALVEFAGAGRLYASVLFLPLAWLGPPIAALAGALAYGLLQLLDADPSHRGLRIALCLAACGAAGAGLAHAAPTLGVGAVAVGALALAIAVVRSLHGSHRRALPLVLPLYCGGLYLDGQRSAALVGLAILLFLAFMLTRNQRWAPVQRAPRPPCREEIGCCR